MFQLRMQRQN